MWRPVPPAGYVAMGCVGTQLAEPGLDTTTPTDVAQPPPLKSVVVVHQRAAVEALLSECMLLCTHGNLWCVQNSVGTFEVSSAESHQPEVGQAAPRTQGALLDA